MSGRGNMCRAAVLALALAWAGPAEAQDIDQQQVCLECHDMADELAAPVRHEPAANGSCSACHNPHVSRFDALLQERPGPLCIGCHGEVADAVAAPVAHAPVADGRCAACHEPHGGAHADLLVASGRDLCLGCHGEVADWSARPVQHEPFRTGTCETCHEPHGGEHEGLTLRPGAELCVDCHTPDSAFRQAHNGYPVQDANCNQCHDPHASQRAGLFRASVHAPFASGDCTTCHALAGSADPFRTKVPMRELCADCHGAEADAATTATFPHVSLAGDRCTTCHNAHTARGSHLLERDLEPLCLGCHDPGGASSGEPGRFVTHADLACTICHEAHGGERPRLLTNDGVTLCAECHTHEHNVSHPLGEGSRDPRNGQPMDCLTCHGIHEAPYPYYLHRSGERDLCVSCHKELAGAGGRR
jgi:predicted CXXCH cytochrome family protein